VTTFVAVMQLLAAAAFASIPLVRHRYGATAMAHAEANLREQGVAPTALADNGMRFDAGGHETAVPVGVAAVLVALAGLNLGGIGWVGIPNWVVLSLVLIGNGAILCSQLTAARSVRAAFARKGDPELARIDVPALLRAAEDGFPAWTWTLQTVRHVAVFGAAILGLAALALA
jgi:hypothetical protein